MDGLTIDSANVQRIRRLYNGQLAQGTRTQTQWYPYQLDAAEVAADAGNFWPAAAIMKSAKRDGIYTGVLSARTAGLVRLPKKFYGDPKICAAMQPGEEAAAENPYSLFNDVLPPGEVARWGADGVELGFAIGEMVPIQGREYPVFTRLDPAFLTYRWNTNSWYYSSIAGLLEVTPGDGRWVLATPGGLVSPWQNAIWKAIARDYIDKDHARNHKANYEGKLANPARVGRHPVGAGEEQAEGFFQQIAAWGVNTVFDLPEGYEIQLLESNGRGWECFTRTIAECDQSMIMTVSGQTVTADGGVGFQNADVFKSIRSDLIQSTGDWMADALSTQALPIVIAKIWGESALDRGCIFTWDTTPPKDANAEALAHVTAANAIKGLREALQGSGRDVDVQALCERYNIPTIDAELVTIEATAELVADSEIANASKEQTED